MEGYLARVRARLPPTRPIVVLPVQSCGCSVEHSAFPGTLSLSAAAALAAWSEIVRSVAKAGVRKLLIVNAHGGNSALVDILAHEMRAAHGLMIVLAAWQRFGYPPNLFSEAERTHGIHGGAIVAGVAAVVGGEKTVNSGAMGGIPKNIVADGPVVTKDNAPGMLWMESHFLI